jgi:hypothetical protein
MLPDADDSGSPTDFSASRGVDNPACRRRRIWDEVHRRLLADEGQSEQAHPSPRSKAAGQAGKESVHPDLNRLALDGFAEGLLYG